MSAPSIRIGLLGSLAISTWEGGALELPSVTQRRLLSILALAAGSVVSATRLCDLLGLKPTALRTSVSRVRRTIGADFIRTAPPGYVLAHADVDVHEFDELISAAARQRATLETLDRALNLWRGEALEEFRDERWAVPAIARLNELCLAAVEERGEALLAAGRINRAIAEMEQQVARHPLREHSYSVLMRGLALDGRTAEALRAFRGYRQHLVDNVGTEPSQSLRELDQRIAAGALGPAPNRVLDGGIAPRKRRQPAG